MGGVEVAAFDHNLKNSASRSQYDQILSGDPQGTALSDELDRLLNGNGDEVSAQVVRCSAPLDSMPVSTIYLKVPRDGSQTSILDIGIHEEDYLHY